MAVLAARFHLPLGLSSRPAWREEIYRLESVVDAFRLSGDLLDRGSWACERQKERIAPARRMARGDRTRMDPFYPLGVSRACRESLEMKAEAEPAHPANGAPRRG